jgi:hypothetical protein
MAARESVLVVVFGLVVAACRMDNPAFDLADADGRTNADDGESDSGSETKETQTPDTGDGDMGDGDGDTGDGDTGDGDGESDTGDGDGESDTGDGDGESDTGDGDGDPIVCEADASDDCGQCIAEFCCNEAAAACMAMADCYCMIKCVDNGNEPMCLQQCSPGNASQELLPQVLPCTAEHCFDKC